LGRAWEHHFNTHPTLADIKPLEDELNEIIKQAPRVSNALQLRSEENHKKLHRLVPHDATVATDANRTQGHIFLTTNQLTSRRAIPTVSRLQRDGKPASLSSALTAIALSAGEKACGRVSHPLFVVGEWHTPVNPLQAAALLVYRSHKPKKLAGAAMQKIEMRSETMSWKIVVPSQGVRVHGNKDEIRRFINDEIAYFSKLAMSGSNITLGNQNYGAVELSSRATEELSRILTDVENDKIDSLEKYINDANARLVLVGNSPVGRRVEQFKQQSVAGATILACIYSENWAQIDHPHGRDLVAILRAVAFANPANFGFDDLLEASRVAEESNKANSESQASAKSIAIFIEEKTRLISELEDLYRRKLTVQEPAMSWKSIAAQKTTIWRIWLFIFTILVALPIGFALWNWELVAATITKLTAASNGGFSISGLAAISVPALFYAWLLKNISRVFIQNLNLADDAAHRQSLALTYMGLLQDDKRPASDAERAIILNALFRPIPPQTSDEGPPAGIIDLIKR
jgi:hypothetical protein